MLGIAVHLSTECRESKPFWTPSISDVDGLGVRGATVTVEEIGPERHPK